VQIRPFSELTSPDERTLRFGGFGLLLDGKLTPEAATEFQQRAVADAELSETVPKMVRDSYERLRELHSYGVLFYDAFTLTSDLRWVTLEMALRERFIDYYSGSIPIVNRVGHTETFDTSSFYELGKAFRKRGTHARGWKLARDGAKYPISMPLTLAPLLRWARGEALLAGQRNRYLEEQVFPDLRNHFAHGTAFSIGMPNRSAQVICDLAEIINRLWGQTTPGGRLYPGPVERDVLVIGWSHPSDEQYSDHALEVMHAGHLKGTTDNGDDWRYIVVRAVWGDPELSGFDADFEMTTLPSNLIWGPGTREDCLAWLNEADPVGDLVDRLDRLFAIRFYADKVFLPRRPEVLAGLEEAARSGRWVLLRADSPFDAFHHARHLNEGTECGDDARCPVEEVASGSWSQVVEAAKRASPGLSTAAVQGIRVPRRHPFPMTVGAE